MLHFYHVMIPFQKLSKTAVTTKQSLKRGSNLCLVKGLMIIASFIKTNLLSKKMTNTGGSALWKVSFMVSPAEWGALQLFQTVKEKFLSWVKSCKQFPAGYFLVFILIFAVLRGHQQQSNDGKKEKIPSRLIVSNCF